MLSASQPAPEFRLLNQHHQPVALADFCGCSHVILYFYPKDDTPGCTIEANQFTALASEFASLGAVVLGVSRDTCTSHQAFIDKYGLKVDLLADVDGDVCVRYGVWQEKERNGEKNMGIVRSTFVIDQQGMLRAALYGVNAEGHAQAMLERMKAL